MPQKYTPSVTVTRRLDYANNAVFFGHGLWAPRWLAVEVWTADGSTYARPADYSIDGWDSGRKVVVYHCATCRGEFVGTAYHRRRHCRVCDTAKRTRVQRERRASTRSVPPCCVCGAFIVGARRGSRRYCSRACQQRAYRERSS